MKLNDLIEQVEQARENFINACFFISDSSSSFIAKYAGIHF
jgi:hypothetical protein